jgi:hypothetical protein
MENIVTVKVNFSLAAYASLAALAQRKGKEMVEVISEALALEEYLDGEDGKGTVILFYKNGRVRELVRR